VRTRYGLPRSDFDRIARQQNFMRALMKKLLAKGTTRNPVRLTRTLSALTENIVVDDEWDPADMRALALSLRDTETDDVTFLTAPVSGTEGVKGIGSVVRLDEARSKALFDAMAADRMEAYVRANPDDVLKSSREIN
jgi:anionic cell wall polymer biosynthesis LytR-Cps2A-Psr (LCP) family protein